MKIPAYPRPFEDVEAFLDFMSNQAENNTLEALSTSPDGRMRASLKQHGSWFSYTLSAGENAEIFSICDNFKATKLGLRAFHTGCATVALNMKRYLRTGDFKWLKIDRPFGPLSGGKEEEILARLLDQVDRLAKGRHVNLEDEESRKRVWELLESIPSSVEYHVEILRRRIEFVWIDQEFNDLPKGARWARALVEAEPFDVKHWWWLADIIGRIDGESAAVAIVREGIERHGPDFSLYYELAALLCSLGQLVEAKEAMILALKEDPCANESALEGECFTLIHDFIKEQQARDCYKKAISSDLAGYHLS